QHSLQSRDRQRCDCIQSCSHRQTHTVVATLRATELMTPAVFDGPIDNATFLTWNTYWCPSCTSATSWYSTTWLPRGSLKSVSRLSTPAHTSGSCRPPVPISIR